MGSSLLSFASSHQLRAAYTQTTITFVDRKGFNSELLSGHIEKELNTMADQQPVQAGGRGGFT